MCARFRTSNSRRGTILVLGAFSLVVVVGMAALALDTGYILVVQTQAQAAADAAALAGASGLTTSLAQVRTNAQSCANLNKANNHSVPLQNSDITVGTWNATTQTFSVSSGTAVFGLNAVKVTVNLTAARGNPVSLFFASALGWSSANVTATAIGGGRRWDVVMDQDITPSFATFTDLSYAITGEQTILSDFNTYSPGSEVGVAQFTGWGSTWVAMQQVGPNYSTINTTIGKLKDSQNNTTTLYNVYGGTTSSTSRLPHTNTAEQQHGTSPQGYSSRSTCLPIPRIWPASRRTHTGPSSPISDGENVADPNGQHPSPTYTANQLNTLSQNAASAAWAQGHFSSCFSITTAAIRRRIRRS